MDVYDRLREHAEKLPDEARQEVLRLIRRLEFDRDAAMILRIATTERATIELPTVNSNMVAYPPIYFDFVEPRMAISVFVPDAFIRAGRPAASFRAEPVVRMRPRGAVRMRRPVRSRPGWSRRRRDSRRKAR